MYDEEHISNVLGTLPLKHRITFAASCCERLVPNYEAFCRMENCGDPPLLRDALETIWLHLLEASIPEGQLQNLARECEPLAPDAEDFSSLFVSAAGDAVASVIYTLGSCSDGDVDRIATVGRLAVETIYLYLLTVNDPDTGVHVEDDNLENQVWEYPLMVTEINKQMADLQLLKSVPDVDKAVIAQIRAESATTGIRPFERGLV